jgi:hypothetical protein
VNHRTEAVLSHNPEFGQFFQDLFSQFFGLLSAREQMYLGICRRFIGGAKPVKFLIVPALLSHKCLWDRSARTP